MRMSLPKSGKLMTAEQSVILAALDSLGREKAIEIIVAQLRAREEKIHRKSSVDRARKDR